MKALACAFFLVPLTSLHAADAPAKAQKLAPFCDAFHPLPVPSNQTDAADVSPYP